MEPSGFPTLLGLEKPWAEAWTSLHRSSRKGSHPKHESDQPFVGAPRIHGEQLKLGIQTSQATVFKYMIRYRKPPSQSWQTFLNNHMPYLVSIDFFTVPTATFRVLYVFLVLPHERRSVLHFAITDHPTAQ